MKRKFLFTLVCCLLIAKTNLFATTWTINVGPGGTMTFSPASDLTVTLGDTVKWVWASGSHTTTSTTIPSGAAAWDQPITSTSTSYTYVPTVIGDYSYQCTPHVSMGMVGSFTVIACTAPVSTTIFGPSAMCAGSAVTLVVPSGPDYTFAWYKNGVVVPADDSNSYAITDTAGIYHYNVVVSDACGSDTTDTLTLVINPVPAAVITDVITGSTVAFSTDTLSGATYAWSFGDGATSTSANPTHTYTTHGVADTVTLTVTSSAGCVGTTHKVVMIPGLGVNTLTTDNAIAIAPNPAKDEAVISYNIPVNTATMKLINVMGSVVYTAALPSQQGRITIPLHDLPAGLYFVTINAGATRYNQKLIKQ